MPPLNRTALLLLNRTVAPAR
eukprot:SAG11_NODE_38506_length_252_cov_0.666667_1_plen_20_part_10